MVILCHWVITLSPVAHQRTSKTLIHCLSGWVMPVTRACVRYLAMIINIKQYYMFIILLFHYCDLVLAVRELDLFIRNNLKAIANYKRDECVYGSSCTSWVGPNLVPSGINWEQFMTILNCLNVS